MTITPNSKQKEVINHKDGPLLVIAGPGSGKTYTIVERVKKLKAKKVDPKKILCITFTEKGAGEMKGRLEKEGVTETTVTTFHSFCIDVCTDNFMQSGLSDQTKLMKETSMQVWCLKNTDKFNFEKIEAGSDMNKTYKGMVQAISNFKEALITSKDFELWLAQKQKEIDKLSEKEKKKKENKKLKKYVEDHIDFNKVYSEYEKFQKKTNIFDFDDMVAKAINLFKKDSTILENYQEKYDYILVDEFQDNNYSQYEIIKMLGAHGNVMVVGDDDQLIMRFQGARQENFDDFRADFSKVKSKTLGENYRCTQEIVNVSELVLKKIDNRIKKTLSSRKKSKEKVQLIRTDTDKAEVEYVVTEIQKLLKQKFVNRDSKKVNYQYGDIAILTRNREYGDKFVQALNAYNIPTTHIGDLNIFETSIISELMLYLRIIHSPSSSGMYLNKLLAAAGIDDVNISTVNHVARSAKRHVYEGENDGIFETLKKIKSLDVTQKKEILEIVKTIESAVKTASGTSVALLVHTLIYSDLTGMMKRCLQLDSLDSRLNIILLNKFYEITEEFQNLNPNDTYQQFLEHLDLLRTIKVDVDETLDIENTVHVMTMHKSKGKQYPVVFIADVAEDRFPSPNRKVTFYVHEELTQGNPNLTFSDKVQDEDERRLFYVGITRAEERLYIVAPKKYGENINDKPLSSLLKETIFHNTANKKKVKHTDYIGKGKLQFNPKEPLDKLKAEAQEQLVNAVDRMQLDVSIARIIQLARIQYFEKHKKDDPDCKKFDPKEILNVDISNVNLSQPLTGTKLPLFNPKKLTLSKSSLESYKTCPYQFQLSKLMRIPSKANVYTDLGSSVHKMIEETVGKTGKVPTKNAAVKKLKEKWIFRSYSRASEEKTFWNRAQKMTDNYLRWRKSNKNKFVKSEASLEYKFAGVTLNGKIDWIEQDKNGDYEIVDFKTSKKAISQNKAEVDWQLHIYAKLIEKEYGKLPTKATLFFLNEDKKITVKIDKKKVKNILEKELKPIIEKILREEFEAKPEHNKCFFQCDYSDICSFKK